MSLNVKRIVNVDVSLSPLAAQQRGFGTLLIIGDSADIPEGEKYRSYTSLEEVTSDFGADAPEALAAQAYFAQSPQPDSLKIARWQNGKTPGRLTGADISQKQMLDLQKQGGFKISINGSEKEITVDLTEAASLDAAAAKLQEQISEAAVEYRGGSIIITSSTSGDGSTVTFASAPTSGTDLSALLGLTEAEGATVEAGKDQATGAADCLSKILEDFGRDFYGVIFAAKAQLSDDDYIECAQLIEAAGDSHILGITLSDTALMDGTAEDSLPELLKKGDYSRTIVFYSEAGEGAAYQLNPYFAASALGRMFTVDFDGSKTTLTLKFKQAPSLQPTDFTETQANRLEDQNVNIYAMYSNDTYIIEPGVMCSGMHADERHGLDWLQDALQTGLYNVLYQSKTKIPQTDDGMAMLKASVEQVLNQAVENGLIAAGKWNSDGFGALSMGDTLPKGFYVYAASVNDQAQAQREARKAPAIQCAIKLAGAIESADVTVNVNR